MSRYLRRVLARTAGQPLGSLQAPQPRRWSSQSSDPFDAADAALPKAEAAALPSTVRAVDDRRAAEDAQHSASVATARDSSDIRHDGTALVAAQRSRARRGYDRADPLLGPELHATAARRESHEPRQHAQPAAESSGSIAARRPDVLRSQPDPRASALLAPSAAAPAQQPSAAAHHASERDQRHTEPSPAMMPPPSAAARETIATREPVQPQHGAQPSAVEARAATIIVAPSPTTRPAPAQPAAAAGREIVIGRISVVVESARASAPTRRVVQHVATTTRTTDDSAGLAHRFGLGQL